MNQILEIILLWLLGNVLLGFTLFFNVWIRQKVFGEPKPLNPNGSLLKNSRKRLNPTAILAGEIGSSGFQHFDTPSSVVPKGFDAPWQPKKKDR